MPDDRPLSRDLPVGTIAVGLRPVRLTARKTTGTPGWWLNDSRDRWLDDDALDAPGSKWRIQSILPSDVPPAEKRCDCTDPPHRTGIVCPVHGLRGVRVSHPMNDPFAGSVEGEPPVESPAKRCACGVMPVDDEFDQRQDEWASLHSYILCAIRRHERDNDDA